MKLVIVESPSKAKTIGKYLGKDYAVIASYGHIRKLPSKQGSVKPEDKFNMVWEETPQAKKYLKDLKANIKNVDEVYLATDPDREGEAISWHLANYLREHKIFKNNISLKRVVFNSITKDSIKEAFLNPREIDNKLVNAYLTRLSLDYLVGFNISPILWYKLPGARSAGRVQSVVLRLIAEKEEAIENFITEEYWNIEALLNDQKNQQLLTKLAVFDNKKLEKLDIKNQQQAEHIKHVIEQDKTYFIKDIIKKSLTRNPYAPFTTSTLQQDAFNRLGFPAKKTMTLAQKLYEGVNLGKETVGLITYMRTDATEINPSFINEIRNYISSKIGNSYLNKSVRQYKTKAKNAQEAHEAIRPSSINHPPEVVRAKLASDEYKLYELIWNRAIASQMESAKYSNTTFEVHNSNSSIVLRASGSILEFEGFYKIYNRNSDSEDETNKLLPDLKINTLMACEKVTAKQSFTEPPPRYTEATIVKNLEELGIGRPSTYDKFVTLLAGRQYIRIENRKLYLEDRGRILNVFLTKFFGKYVDFNFTANMEEQLDAISNGNINHYDVLNEFWNNFIKEVEYTKQISPALVFEALNQALAAKFIGEDLTCPTCKTGTLSIKTSKFGAFIGCSNYPECKHIKNLQITSNDNENSESTDANEATITNKETVLLDDQDNNKKITLKKGPYGPYLEYVNGKAKIKRAAIPKSINPTGITLDQALLLVELPKKITNTISLGIGRFGPFLKEGANYFSVKEDIFTLDKEKAENIIKEQTAKKLGIVLGVYPKTNNNITLKFSRFGGYLVYNNENIKIPKEYKSLKENLPLDIAIKIIGESINEQKKK
ncbi:type I DNA topoisomerase [Rickettsiales bacterium LUAb2]